MVYLIPKMTINVLKKRKPYSQSDAFLDILSMADESGQFCSSTRKLMERWGWGNTRTTSFLKELEKNDICKTQTRHKQDTLFMINTSFLDSPQGTNKTQTRHKQDAKQSKNFQISISKDEAYQKIVDAWNELSAYGIVQISVESVSYEQRQSIVGIAKEYGVEDILETIGMIKNSNFLQGNKTNFKVTFDWFLTIQNYEKIRNGKYDDMRYQSNSYMDAIKNRVNIVDTWLED